MKKTVKVLMALLIALSIAGCQKKAEIQASISFNADKYLENDEVVIHVQLQNISKNDIVVIDVTGKDNIGFERRNEISGIEEFDFSLNWLEADEYEVKVLVNDSIVSTASFIVEKGVLQDLVITVEETDDCKLVSFNTLPTDVSQLQKALDFTDEYAVAATLITVLAHYEINPEKALEMLDYIDGPNEIGNVDKAQMKEQFKQYPYVCRSYFENTSVENNYTCDSYTIRLFENDYSRTEDNYVFIRVFSSGADSSRAIGLRQKKSTGEWFADNYLGLLAGIRIAAETDPWN